MPVIIIVTILLAWAVVISLPASPSPACRESLECWRSRDYISVLFECAVWWCPDYIRQMISAFPTHAIHDRWLRTASSNGTEKEISKFHTASVFYQCVSLLVDLK